MTCKLDCASLDHAENVIIITATKTSNNSYVISDLVLLNLSPEKFVTLCRPFGPGTSPLRLHHGRRHPRVNRPCYFWTAPPLLHP